MKRLQNIPALTLASSSNSLHLSYRYARARSFSRQPPSKKEPSPAALANETDATDLNLASMNSSSSFPSSSFAPPSSSSSSSSGKLGLAEGSVGGFVVAGSPAMDSIRSEIFAFQQSKRQKAYLLQQQQQQLQKQQQETQQTTRNVSRPSTSSNSSYSASDLLPMSAYFSDHARSAQPILTEVQRLEQEEQQHFDKAYRRDVLEVLRGPGLASNSSQSPQTIPNHTTNTKTEATNSETEQASSSSAPTPNVPLLNDDEAAKQMKLLSMSVPVRHWKPLREARQAARRSFQEAVQQAIEREMIHSKPMKSSKNLDEVRIPSDILLSVLEKAEDRTLREWLRYGVVDPAALLMTPDEAKSEPSNSNIVMSGSAEKEKKTTQTDETTKEDEEAASEEELLEMLECVRGAEPLEKLTYALAQAPMDPQTTANLLSQSKQKENNDNAVKKRLTPEQLDEALRSPSPVLNAVSAMDPQFAKSLDTLNRIRRTYMMDQSFVEAIQRSQAQDRQSIRKYFEAREEQRKERLVTMRRGGKNRKDPRANLTLQRGTEGTTEGRSVSTPPFFGSAFSRPPPSASMALPMPRRKIGARKLKRSRKTKRFSQ